VVELEYPQETIRIEKQEEKKPDDDAGSASTEDTWVITKPKEIPADQYAMSIFFSDMDRILAQDFIDEKDVDESLFGLDNPQLQISIHEKEMPEPKILRVGNTVTGEKKNYAHSNMGNVYFYMSDQDLKNVEKQSFDFRDKVVFQFQRASVKKVSIKFPDRSIVIAVKDKKYRMIEPEKAVLNNLNVDDLLWSIDRIEMESIVESPQSDLKLYGLDKPRAELTVEKANGEIIGPLLLGNVDPEDSTRIFAKLQDQSLIFTVKKSIFDSLNVTPDDLKQ
jgi:hypothetical protein